MTAIDFQGLQFRNITNTLGGNMKFGEAISSAFKNYATFKGRTRLSPFLFFILFVWAAVFAAVVLDLVLFPESVATVGFGPIYLITVLALFLPILTILVRRFHDVDKSGWFGFVPFYGYVLLCTDSTPGTNRFGDATN
jgi:uncharacterized membrane protein YhaH (DUF805 family)